ncbi:MAG: efflux RND transporter periplasmic adaptor subunit [Chloroflexi bacterium]|nr:efflux RND transporter periplasmic adaptor subunit [Chloroflexota bacterium]
MRTFLIALVLLILLAVGGWFGYQNYWLPRQTVAAKPHYITMQARRDTLASTISATGNLEAAAQVSLAFRSAGGRVGHVLVSEGQRVTKGQRLAELETTDLTLALAQAKVNLEISQAQLEKLQTPPTSSDLAVARAAVDVAEASVTGAQSMVNSAQAGYNQLLASTSADQKTVDEAQLRQAEAKVTQAQHAYNDVKGLPNVGALPQSVQLEQATLALEAARAQAAVIEQGPNQAQVAAALNQIAQAQVGVHQAQSNVVTAKSRLQTLLDGPKKADVEIAEAQVRQTQLAQLQAQNNLSNAQLIAPRDGIISQVNIHEGEMAGGAQPALVLTDLASLQMKVFVDEIDMHQVQVGQRAQLSVDALPGEQITGKVTDISPTANRVSGVIAYEVTILPDATQAALRAGMSATALITTAQVKDAVLLPNRFIQIDHQTKQAFVYKMVNDQPVVQTIQFGLRTDNDSQVLTGLAAGDQVALVTLH